MKAKRVSVAPDSFKETLHATEVARAIYSTLDQAGIEYDSMPMSDGGEGFADVIAAAIKEDGDRNAQVSLRTASVTGPTGSNVLAQYYQVKEEGQPMMAIMDCASASGLALAGGAGSNDPIAATSRGTGELIADAINSGSQAVLIGLGGSATTDGGKPAIEAAKHLCDPDKAKIVACYDVKSRFTEAARIFAPQKGATPEQIDILDHRLEDLTSCYKAEYGVDVTDLTGGGAAGGLGGGLTLLGAELMSGFEVVAEYVHLEERLKVADLVITGEGKLDATSFEGKVVGSIIRMAHEIGIPVAVIAGSVENGLIETGAINKSMGIELLRLPGTAKTGAAKTGSAETGAAEVGLLGHGSEDTHHVSIDRAPVQVVSLVDRFGRDASLIDTIGCIEKAVGLICG